MFLRHLARLARLGAALILWGLCHSSYAAELGEPQVRSFIGQPLVADIELTNLVDEGRPVQVKLAHQEVYNGANISMHPVLANVRMSVMRRDGRQFLHITSIKTVDSEYVHVFFELSDGGKAFVRGTTLWLTVDPHPAPPPSAAPPATGAEADEAPAAPARQRVAAPAVRVHKAAKPAACPTVSEEEKAKSCAEIDYKNGLLTAQIVELEDKVRLLQTAIGGKVPASMSASAVASASATASSQPPPRLGSAGAGKAKAKPKLVESTFPWLWIAVGVTGLALAAGGGYVWWRKRGKGKDPAAPKLGLVMRLKQMLRKKEPAPLLDKEEPTAE